MSDGSAGRSSRWGAQKEGKSRGICGIVLLAFQKVYGRGAREEFPTPPVRTPVAFEPLIAGAFDCDGVMARRIGKRCDGPSHQ